MYPNFENKYLKIKLLTLQLFNQLKIYWLPIVLILIFVIQNHLFNAGLNIPVRSYFIRRSIVTTAFGLLLFGPALWLNKWKKYLYLSLTSIVVTLVFVIQFIYYSYSGGFLQASAIFYAGQGMAVLSTIKTLLTYQLIIFSAGPLVIITALILAHNNITVEKILHKNEKILASLIILLFVISGYSYIFIREKMESGNTVSIYKYSRLFNVNALVSKIGIINFSLGDILSLGFQVDNATAADIKFVNKYKELRSTTTVQNVPDVNFGILKGRNLILIQVESLENAVVGQKIDNQEITPNLNKLANQGLYFSNYYAPIGPGTTADAEFMTLNSLYSLPDTTAFIRYAYNNYTALPGLLKENGYHTYAFHGDVPSFWNRANIYPQLGYEKWFSRQDYIIPRKIGVYDLGDKDFFEQSIPKLKSLPQPFMATLITLTSHTPFELPTDLKTLNFSSTTTLNLLQQNYLQSIHYTDQAIGEFINQLKSADLYNNSLILIYGDHNSFSKISKGLGIKNSIFADLQVSQVPMIILAPGTPFQGSKITPASHLDVYPTTANLLGITPPTDIFGHDIINGNDAVAISRNLVSGTIISILTNELAYHTAASGIFEDGTCLKVLNKKKLTVDSCKLLYEEQVNNVMASDLMIKGNLINSSKAKLPH